MRNIILLFTTAFLMQAARANVVVKEASETPAAFLGYTILNSIEDGSTDSTHVIQQLKNCLALSFDAALTQPCQEMPVTTVTFDQVKCRYSGAFLGPASCYIQKIKDGTDNQLNSIAALQLLAALEAAGAYAEGAAGSRFVIVNNVTMTFDLSKFEGGAGSYLSFETEDFTR